MAGLNYLSKSKYMRGISCPRVLWYEINRPTMAPPVDAATQARFDMGHEVGDLAKTLYPDGVEITWGDGYRQAVADTREAMKNRLPIFEATFLHQSASAALLSRADLLIPADDDKWDMIEVKSGNSVKDEHPDDVAFQLHVMRGAGVDVRRAFLMHLDRQYRRQGPLEPHRLFISEDLTDRALSIIPEISDRVARLWDMLTAPDPPDMDLINQCGSPNGCDFGSVCWGWLPERHVGELYRNSGCTHELLSMGVHRLADIPDDYPLTYRQNIQRAAARSGKPHIETEAVAAFIGRLRHPLYAMDFETLQTALPLFDGMGTWHQLPFQFSVHKQTRPGNSLEHLSFLADLEGGRKDPRRDFMAGLQNCLGDSGDILVYNAAFEIRILNETAAALPQYSDWVHESVFPRIVDLLDVFRSFAYYHPSQGGSCSLKSVVPALLGSGYEEMEIADGGAASSEYLRVSLNQVGPEEAAMVRKNLEAYCAKDTESLFDILDHITRLTGG